MPGLMAPRDDRVCKYPAHSTHQPGKSYAYKCNGECVNDDDKDGICDECDEDYQASVSGYKSFFCNFNPPPQQTIILVPNPSRNVFVSVPARFHNYIVQSTRTTDYDKTATEKICRLAELSGNCVAEYYFVSNLEVNATIKVKGVQLLAVAPSL